MKRQTKRIWIGLKSNIYALLSIVYNVLEFICDLAVNLFAVPLIALRIAIIGICMMPLGSSFFLDGSLWKNLFHMLSVCVPFIILYFILQFLLRLISGVIQWLVDLFKVNKKMDKLSEKVEFVILEYMILMSGESPSKTDRQLLFGIPFLIGQMRQRMNAVWHIIQIAMYPAGGAFGAYVGYEWYQSTIDDGWRQIDYLVAVIATLILIMIGIYLGRCVALVIQNAKDNVSPVEYVYETFYSSFRDCDENNTWDNCQHDSSGNHVDEPNLEKEMENNPFYWELAQETTIDGLKKRYRKLSMEFHPDTTTYDKGTATARQVQLNAAKDYLMKKLTNSNNREHD